MFYFVISTRIYKVIAEGWAAPLRGFMREGALVETLHFNSMLVDMHNVTGNSNAGYVCNDTEMQNPHAAFAHEDAKAIFVFVFYL